MLSLIVFLPPQEKYSAESLYVPFSQRLYEVSSYQRFFPDSERLIVLNQPHALSTGFISRHT
jgi:hypothetical protein